jgi:2'-phosphotransferase
MADQEDRILDKVEGNRRGGSSRGRGRGGGAGAGAGAGGGGRSRGSGGGGGSRETQISRALSKLLRHQALSAGIVLDGEGFAPLNKVVR